eukprot:CAMPEP_0197076228 /NCGR_PEP_ID=MMETSP1384-20130603/212009_1 /TAXON_ID=29189 /ORGANISM="Ammonia sp." /LENGTH=1059 /DNA_ID=CAMNT_0042515081 /DNA_START=31 /DNA_END=3210 /DNA_ORIENTATION=+
MADEEAGGTEMSDLPSYGDVEADADTDAKERAANNDPEIEQADATEHNTPSEEMKEDDPLITMSQLSATSKSNSPVGSAVPSDSASYNNLKSTLKKKQRAWVDPYEAAVGDTFYHKQIDTLRPKFDLIRQDSNKQALNKLFTVQSVNDMDIKEDHDDDDDNDNPDDVELQEQENDDNDNPDDVELQEQEKQQGAAKKFGPWDGVMAGCLLNIFGVIMFLRVGFVVGQAGILQALIIMAISTAVTVLTALSMSAICTNGTILAGGAYYIISRALGPSIGGAIGILFSIGNMVACSMYLIGFAETMVTNLRELAGFSIFDDPVNDVRVWSNVVLVFVLILAIVGLKYVIKAQLGLLVFISCAILLFFIGSFYRTYTNHEYPCDLPYDAPADPQCVDDVEYISKVTITPQGWTNGNFAENLGSQYVDGYNFWSVLGIFFPAVTGIMAGANISGDLRNPSQDIPQGTLTAIVISTVVYMLMGIFVGAVTDRYELLSNELVMSLICVWEGIVLIGIYAATLSSAIASLVGAPRILQAVANDNLFPFKWLMFFAHADKNGNPIRGYFLSFFVAMACNCIGALNAIAPLISQFFMLTYLLINAACFALTFSKSPAWRPSFKYYNKWTAGFGTLLCLVIMFLLNWVYAVVACVIALSLYGYIEYKDPAINWGSAPEARAYYSVYNSLIKLQKKKQHIKTWRPAFLVLVRDPVNRPQLMLFTQTLKKSHGPLFYATVHTGDYRTNIRKFHAAKSNGYLPKDCPKNAKGFYYSVIADSLRSGVQNCIQLIGAGSLQPNTLVLGFKTKWATDSDAISTEFVQILRDALVMGMGLMVVSGFKRVNWFLKDYAPPAIDQDDEYEAEAEAEADMEEQEEMPPTHLASPSNMSTVQPAAWAAGQAKDTTIDVWWMIDDGGLCMLIPYIMKRHVFWGKCKLRMIMVTEEDSINMDVAAMKDLIKQFRLPYQGPLFVPARKQPSKKTVARYEELAKCKLSEVPRPSVISKWLILSELLFEYSRYSGMNVVTLPIPTKHMKSRAYMALIEMLSDQKRLPPTIVMRGNGESTLTFYSD